MLPQKPPAAGSFRGAFVINDQEVQIYKVLYGQIEAVLTSIYSHPQSERGLPLDQPMH